METYKKEIIYICIGLALITVMFYIFDIDIKVQQSFYNNSDGWQFASSNPWQQIRDYSSLPALLIALTSLILIILSFNFPKYAAYRKIFLFLVVLMVVAPGLIVNLLLKDNFGRPRPRDIHEFAGKYAYEKPLIYDGTSPGKSFPCGHASMGFYFFGIYILFRHVRRLLAITGLVLGFLWGGLIGFTRMLQGGHFLSDVLFSGAIVYLSALILFRVFKFTPNLKNSVITVSTAKKRIFTAVLSILSVLIIMGVLLATPRDKKHTVHFDRFQIENAKQVILDLELLDGQIKFVPADSLALKWQFQAFGFPKSNIRHNQNAEINDGIYTIDLQQYIRGFFTEMQQTVTIFVPRQKHITVLYSQNGEQDKREFSPLSWQR